jgi:hypothetical protein
MNFATSSQRKSWIFSEESLAACRDKASRGSNDGAHSSRVQKFASGFHARQVVDTCGNADTSCTNVSSATTKTDTKGPILSIRDQETLVQFHAHQIQTLVGPYALLPELRRSQKVLSTAIALFRRFFLSNSVIECNPRKIAAAAALFAAKSEEEKIEVRSPSSCHRQGSRFHRPAFAGIGGIRAYVKYPKIGQNAQRTFWSICKCPSSAGNTSLFPSQLQVL